MKMADKVSVDNTAIGPVHNIKSFRMKNTGLAARVARFPIGVVAMKE